MARPVIIVNKSQVSRAHAMGRFGWEAPGAAVKGKTKAPSGEELWPFRLEITHCSCCLCARTAMASHGHGDNSDTGKMHFLSSP